VPANLTGLPTDGIDLSSLDFWAKPLAEREAAFAGLRGLAEPRFFTEPEIPFVEAGPGYFALVNHADVVTASCNPAIFSSAAGAISITDLPDEYNEFSGSMINMDDPKHCRLRRLVFRSFTQRNVDHLIAHIQAVAATIVGDLITQGGGDFVAEVAARLPLTVMCDLMGVPASMRDFVGRRAVLIIAGVDPDYAVIGESGVDPGKTADQMLAAALELAELVGDLAAKFRSNPADNIISRLCQPDADGDYLTDQEIASFFILLIVAGHETTKNAISHGLLLLSASPGQRALWASDFDRYAPSAVEEIIRLSSPIVWMRRTLTQDYQLRNCSFREGDKALLFYWSANRDEAVFTEPHRFDITRDPNPHVGFGAPGHHFCLGARLARAQIVAMFRELFRRAPDICPCGEPQLLLSNFVSGVKSLPCDFTRAGD
jgi:methyl-branched lipid omega-hydroxylase